VGSSVEQQSIGLQVKDVHPRSCLHRAASMTIARSGRPVLVATRSRLRDAAFVGGSAAQESRAWSGIGYCISTARGVNLRFSAQPDVRADIRPAAGCGSTVR